MGRGSLVLWRCTYTSSPMAAPTATAGYRYSCDQIRQLCTGRGGPRPPRRRPGPSGCTRPDGPGSPEPRSRQPLSQPTRAKGCSLQVPEVVAGVRLNGVRDVRVVHDLTEVVEEFGGRRWAGLARCVVGHAHIVTEGAADRDRRGSVGGPWLRHVRAARAPRGGSGRRGYMWSAMVRRISAVTLSRWPWSMLAFP